MSGQINHINRTYLFFAIVMAGALLVGCATTIKMYPGPERPAEEVATLEITNIRVVVFDSVPVAGKKLVILPGEHYMRINHDAGPLYPDMLASYTFAAKPGHQYRVGADYKVARGLSMTPWVMDLTENIRVGGWER